MRKLAEFPHSLEWQHKFSRLQRLAINELNQDHPRMLAKVIGALSPLLGHRKITQVDRATEGVLTALEKHCNDKDLQFTGGVALFWVNYANSLGPSLRTRMSIALIKGMWFHRHDSELMHNGFLTLSMIRLSTAHVRYIDTNI